MSVVTTDVQSQHLDQSHPVHPEAALTALPRTYRLALTLRRLGADDALIADCLGVEPLAVAPLVEVGRRKLHQLEGM